MRARSRPLAAVVAGAAATAVSLPLWASTAGAGSDPDESNVSIRTALVNGVECQVRLVSNRYGSSVYGSTEVITTADQCRASQVYVNVEFLSVSGDTVSASSDDEGPLADVAGGGATDLVRTFHGVNFLAGSSASYTMASK